MNPEPVDDVIAHMWRRIQALEDMASRTARDLELHEKSLLTVHTKADTLARVVGFGWPKT